MMPSSTQLIRDAIMQRFVAYGANKMSHFHVNVGLCITSFRKVLSLHFPLLWEEVKTASRTLHLEDMHVIIVKCFVVIENCGDASVVAKCHLDSVKCVSQDADHDANLLNMKVSRLRSSVNSSIM